MATILVATSNGELTFFEEEGGLPRVDASLLALLPLAALWLLTLDFALIDWVPACLTAMAAGVLVAGLTLRRLDFGRALMVGAGVGVWVWSVATETNVLATAASTTFARTEVLSMRETGGSDSSHYLTLAPPRYPGVPAEVDVGRRLYAATRVGDELCIHVHRGALSWRWYEVDFCPT